MAKWQPLKAYNKTVIGPVSWQQQTTQNLFRFHRVICSNVLNVKPADYKKPTPMRMSQCAKVKRAWESALWVEKVWKSMLKSERVLKIKESMWRHAKGCESVLKKYTICWESVPNIEKVCECVLKKIMKVRLRLRNKCLVSTPLPSAVSPNVGIYIWESSIWLFANISGQFFWEGV